MYSIARRWPPFPHPLNRYMRERQWSPSNGVGTRWNRGVESWQQPSTRGSVLWSKSSRIPMPHFLYILHAVFGFPLTQFLLGVETKEPRTRQVTGYSYRNFVTSFLYRDLFLIKGLAWHRSAHLWDTIGRISCSGWVSGRLFPHVLFNNVAA